VRELVHVLERGVALAQQHDLPAVVWLDGLAVICARVV
jgi:hypothetical protein